MKDNDSEAEAEVKDEKKSKCRKSTKKQAQRLIH